jgi:hypothetical protein
MKNKSAVTRPPIPTEEAAGQGTENLLTDSQRQEQLLRLIRKGAPSVPKPDTFEDDEEAPVKFTLRYPRSVSERIEEAKKDRPVNTPVNTWIIEAILEKLKKEGF